MSQNRWRLGLRPRPHWGSLQRSPDPLAGRGGGDHTPPPAIPGSATEVIDVGTRGKLVNSACLDKQHVRLHATVLTLDELIGVDITILGNQFFLGP